VRPSAPLAHPTLQVRALGGRIAGPAAADLCVVCGGASVPRALPAAAPAVTDEWLLAAAEQYQAPPPAGRYLAGRA